MAVPAPWETQHAAPTIHSACSRSNDLYIISGSHFQSGWFSREDFPFKLWRKRNGQRQQGRAALQGVTTAAGVYERPRERYAVCSGFCSRARGAGASASVCGADAPASLNFDWHCTMLRHPVLSPTFP